MNSFLKNLTGLAIIFFSCTMSAQSQEIMAILSDNLKPVSTNYIIYPETSNLISQEISNRMNLNGHIKALPVCNSISNAQKQSLDDEVITFVKEYKYTYNLNYEILRKIANKLGATYILLVSSSLDTETSFLKETIWSKISIAGENSVNPSYRIVTHITLIDPKNELILFEKNYDSILVGRDFDLAIPTFSPSPMQLKKIHKVSVSLANNVTPIIEAKIMPELLPVQDTFIEKVNFFKKSNQQNQKQTIQVRPQQIDAININANKNLKLFNYVEGDL